MSGLFGTEVARSAVLSADRRYRYSLTRAWRTEGQAFGRHLVVVGLNPSTADETEDDPTIRRCVFFAQRWGHSGLVMVNLFAWRATEPAGLDAQRALGNDIIGEANDATLATESHGRRVVLAWGAFDDPFVRVRRRRVETIVTLRASEVACFGRTKNGGPIHPMARGRKRLSDDVKLVPWKSA